MDTRELHEDVLRGAQVIVEDVEAARREAGDVAIAVEKGALAWDDVVTMAEVVRGEVALDPARRVVFKTVGMPWEDLAVARVVGVADSALSERGDSSSVNSEIRSREPWLRRNIEGVFSAAILALCLAATYLIYPVPGQLETVVSPSDTISVQVAEPEKWERINLSWDWESRVPYLPVSESPLEPGPTLWLDGYLKDPLGNDELTMGFWGEIGNQVSECYLQTWADDFEDLVPQELEAERGNSSRPADLTFVASMESVDYSDDNGTPPGIFVLCRFEPNSVWAVDPPYRDFVIPKMQIESPRGLPAGNFCVESATPIGTWSGTPTTSTASDCSEGAQRIALEGQSAQLEDAGERRTRDFKVLASGVFAGLAAESAISLLRMLFIPGSRNGRRRREHD